MQDDSDITLMLELQNGSRTAFERLIHRHQEAVLNLAFRILGDRDEAEDLTQDIFFKVYRARESYRPEARFTTWLYRIASNACLNAVRARKNRRSRFLEELGADNGREGAEPMSDPKAAMPPTTLIQNETAWVLREIVEGLPDAQRLAIWLNKYQGLSYDEVAESMNLSVMAVKSLLFRARECIKDRLIPYLREEVR